MDKASDGGILKTLLWLSAPQSVGEGLMSLSANGEQESVEWEGPHSGVIGLADHSLW